MSLLVLNEEDTREENSPWKSCGVGGAFVLGVMTLQCLHIDNTQEGAGMSERAVRGTCALWMNWNICSTVHGPSMYLQTAGEGLTGVRAVASVHL